MLEVDKMLEKCGDFHRQQLIMLLLSSLISLLSSLHSLSYSITNTVPKHWCADGLGSGPPPPNADECKPFYTNSSTSGTCKKYNYEHYMGFQSFVSEMNWICDEKSKLSVGSSVFFAGCVIGNLVMGYFADRLGRVPMLVFANVMTILSNFLTIFGMSLELFCIYRFVIGLVFNSNFSIIRILLVEYMRPSLRTVCVNICYGLFLCLGMIISPWIAILTGSWRRFMLLEALPIIVVPFFFYFVPESVQWLISRQKYDEAIESLRRVAKTNGRQIDDSVYEEFIEDCKLSQQNTKTNPNLLHLFGMPRLRRTLLILLFEYLTAIVLQDRIGRKTLAFTIVLIKCISVLVEGVVFLHYANRSPKTQLTFYVIAAFFSYLSFDSNIQYALEVIPTCVRGQALGSLYAISFASVVCENCVLNMRKIFFPLPEIILGVLTLLLAGLILLLPETLDRTLPSSLEDGEQLGIDEHWYTFRCMQKHKQPEELDSSLAPRNGI
ncbi:solute carrier family 22 member 3-like isoform X2 [Drosophila novamexicana]|uniref:solute carrier family 22 member 3-like isoform X2 n=1 Tax=Drosophila novamexicana TaxID=47314 RepID=UPI0011E59D0E|nr:solute carrier family 22 member 3-like isoform X2 [Drosophila novamexicana]